VNVKGRQASLAMKYKTWERFAVEDSMISGDPGHWAKPNKGGGGDG